MPRLWFPLPWIVAGRTVRPFAFALMLSCLVVFTGLVFRDTVGDVFDPGTLAGKIMAATAAVAVVFLTAGFWTRSEWAMRTGMLAAFGLWSATFVGLSLDIGWWTSSALLAGCWAVAAAGAWLLEVSGQRRPGDPLRHGRRGE